MPAIYSFSVLGLHDSKDVEITIKDTDALDPFATAKASSHSL